MRTEWNDKKKKEEERKEEQKEKDTQVRDLAFRGGVVG